MVNAAVMQLAQGPAGPVPGAISQQSGASDGSIFGDLLSVSLGSIQGVQGDEPSRPAGDSADLAALLRIGALDPALAGAMIAQSITAADPSTVQTEASGEQAVVDTGSAVATVSALPLGAGPAAEPEWPVTAPLAEAETPFAAQDAQPSSPRMPQDAGAISDATLTFRAPVQARGFVTSAVTPADLPVASTALPGAPVPAGVSPDAPVTLPFAVSEPAVVPLAEDAAAPEANASASQPAADPKPQTGTGPRPAREAFLLAAQPASEPAEPLNAVSRTRSGLQAGTESGHYANGDASRIVQAVQSPAQVQDRPADANRPLPETSDASDAASVLTQAEPFRRAVAEASATNASQPARPDSELHTRVIDQLVRAVSLHRFQDRTDLVVKLHPPELGTLSVRVTQDAQGLTSQIQATSENVRSLLQAHLPLLADALADAGVRLNSVTVTSDASLNALMHDSAQGSGQQQYDTPPERFGGALEAVGAPESFDSPASLLGSAGYSWLA